MPELPEMENYKRLLTEKIQDQCIMETEIQREKSINVDSATFQERICGHSITRIDRRAKHLLFHVSSGDVLVLHLMLGGWMFYGTMEQKPERTVQVRLDFGDGLHLFFIGLRLGYLHLYTDKEAEKMLAKLGPEPLAADFTDSGLRKALRSKRGILKSTLVDQHVISGIGNCYSDEICFEAGLLPMRRTVDLTDIEMTGLYRGMRTILLEAIDYGGYMESPLFSGDALTGGYNDRCRVYDNGGKPCMRCGQPIEQHEVASRKCFYCPNCQT